MSQNPDCPYCGSSVSIDHVRAGYDEKVRVRCSNCGSVHSHFPVKVQVHNVKLGQKGRNLVIKEIPIGQLKLLHVSNQVVGLAVQFVVA